MEHELINAYPVLVEKPGTFVAQFSYTVAILKGQIMVLAGLPLNEALFVSEHEIKDDKVLELLNTSIEKKKKK
jgi:hypothetical protein